MGKLYSKVLEIRGNLPYGLCRELVGVDLRYIAAFCLLALFASPVRAEWREASSDHFVIYADTSERTLRGFSEDLERYHSAMEFLTNRRLPVPSPSNRVTIYVVGSEKGLKDLYGEGGTFVAGFYRPRAGNTVAFIPKLRTAGSGWAQTVLLHEYAHHFLISSSSRGMPRWLSEGAAEFFASAEFENSGDLTIGRPAIHRANELMRAAEVSIYELLDEETYRAKKRRRYDAFYGRSWLLYHYLTFDEDRKGQFAEYWAALAQGMAALPAAKQAFGDLDQLDKDLDSYLRNRRWMLFTLNSEMTRVGEISIRSLSDGMAEMMPVRMRSKNGVDDEAAAEVIVDAREVAARYPNDPGVLAALAEAEYDAGFDDAAIAAADKALAIDPSRVNAYLQKGYALHRKAQDAASDEDEEAFYKSSIAAFMALNKIENDHPVPLVYYYNSFRERGRAPTEVARRGLERAAVVAPYDKGLWFDLVQMLAMEGKIALAGELVKALTSDPHGGEMTGAAAFFAAELEGATEGEPFSPDWNRYVPVQEVEVPDVE